MSCSPWVRSAHSALYWRLRISSVGTSLIILSCRISRGVSMMLAISAGAERGMGARRCEVSVMGRQACTQISIINLFVLAEAVVDQREQRRQGLVLVFAVHGKLDLRALAGRQHHDTHDALAVGVLAIVPEGHVALVVRSEADEFGRGTRMHSQLVDYLGGHGLHRLSSVTRTAGTARTMPSTPPDCALRKSSSMPKLR